MSNFNLSEFKNAVVSPARTNKFRVLIFPPKIGIAFDLRFYAETLSFYASSCTFPTVQLNTDHAARRTSTGVEERFPSSVEYRDLIVDFIADSEGHNYDFFDSWQNYIAPHAGTPGNVALAYKDNYSTIIKVQALTETGDIHMTHIYESAYPMMVTGGKYQWSDTDNPLTFTVVFDFLNMKTVKGNR